VPNAVPAVFERRERAIRRSAAAQQRWRAGLRHPAYNFNDDAIIYGTSYWIKLVETILAA
jgi:hypothetical protein